MRRLMVGALLLVVSSPVVRGQVPPVPDTRGAKAGGQPKLFIEKQNLELGDVVEGDMVDLLWKIENQGDADLVIQRVQPSCGCTVVDVPEDQKTIKPGKTLEIKGQFNSTDRPGEQNKAVAVYSNDPREGELRLTFKAKVRRLYEMRPATGVVHIKNLQRGEASSKTLDVLSQPGEPPVEIVSLEFPADAGVSTKIEPFTEDSSKLSGQRVSFVVKEGAPLDRLAAEGLLKVRIGNLDRERKITVRGTVIGELTVRPNLVDTTRTTSRRGQRLAPVRISPAGANSGFKILSADGGPLLKTEIEPAEEAGQVVGYFVRAQIREDAPIGPFGATIRVKTNSADQPMIEIPVFGTVSSPVAVTPAAVLFNLGPPVSSRSRTITLDASPEANLQISEITSDNPALAAAYDASSGTAAVRMIEITVTGKPASGVHEAKVVVSTNIKDAEKIEIPVTLIVP